MNKFLANDPNFLSALGLFYTMWAANDMAVDYAVGKFMKIPHEETHLLTASLDFNRRVSLLRALVSRNKPPKQGDIFKALNTIQNDSLRNVFAHSFLRSNPTRVTFVERSRHGRYQVKDYGFTLEEFRAHVLTFVKACQDFQRAIEATDDDIEAFSIAAANVRANAETSPVPPKSKA